MSFILQFFIVGALSLLWNIFNTFQLLIAFELLQVSFPSNVTLISQKVDTAVNFQIIPDEFIRANVVDPFFNDVWSPAESERVGRDSGSSILSDNHNVALEERFGGSNFLVKVAASMILVFIAVILIVLVVACKKYLVPRMCNCLQKLVQIIEAKLLFNSVLRTILELYMITVVNALYGLKSVQIHSA